MCLYSVKMRGSKDTKHISGAENIIEEKDLEKVVSLLLKRAMNHEKGKSDFINFKIEKIEDTVEIIKPLEVTTINCNSYLEGKAVLNKILQQIKRGIESEKIVDMLYKVKDMRGAILLDINNLKRLEREKEKGIRCTYMDLKGRDLKGLIKSEKFNSHFIEALVLSSKVNNCPYIIGELCISDDPNYTTGYISSKELGYIRITNIKEKKIPYGGRIFLYDSSLENIERCIDYIENKKILISEDIKIKEEISFKEFMKK